MSGIKRKEGAKTIFKEVIMEMLSNVGYGQDTDVQEAERTPKLLSPSRPTPRHTLSKGKDKETNSQANREKNGTYDLHQIFLQEPWRSGESGKVYSKLSKTTTSAWTEQYQSSSHGPALTPWPLPQQGCQQAKAQLPLWAPDQAHQGTDDPGGVRPTSMMTGNCSRSPRTTKCSGSL